MEEEIFHCTLEMLGEKFMVEDDKLILPHEKDPDRLYKPAEEVETSDSDEYEPTEEKRRKLGFIPRKTKIKVLKLAREHLTWSLETLQRKGSMGLRWKDDLQR